MQDNIQDNKQLILDIYEKLIGESDMLWDDIRKKYNLDCPADTLRRAGPGIKLAAEAGALSFGTDEQRQYDAEYKAKREFYDQRREYNKLLAADARWNNLVGVLKDAASELGNTKPLFLRQSEVDLDEARMASKNEAVLFLSDWHYGLESDNVWNQYNVRIARERIRRMLLKVRRKLEENNVAVLHIAILGDMIAGAIHNSIRVASSENAVEQIMSVSELLAECIAELAPCARDVCVYCTYGNHARTTQKLDESIHADNMERIIPFWLKERLRDVPNLVFPDNNAFEMMRIVAAGNEICALHGDLDCGKANAMLTLSMLYEKQFERKMEYLVMGHWHTRYMNEALGIEQIGVGSLCGTDEYAKNKRLFSKPSQTMMIFNSDGLDSIHDMVLE